MSVSNHMNTNKHDKNDLLLVNFALSLQAKITTDVTAEQLSDFISGHADENTRSNVIQAINASPSLLQQWVDINQILGNLVVKQRVQATNENKSLFGKLKQWLFKPWLFKPWLIPATAMALTAVFFIPQLIKPKTDDLLNGIYNDWSAPVYETRSIKPQLESQPIMDAVDLYQQGFAIGKYLWIHFKNSGERAEPWDLCLDNMVENCQAIQKLAIHAGQLKGMLESHCGSNPSDQFIKDAQTSYQNIQEGLDKYEIEFLLDFEDEILYCVK